MIDKLKRFFAKSQEKDAKDGSPASEHDVRVAVCALFVEMARIDQKFTQSEMETILSILKEKYGYCDSCAAEAISVVMKKRYRS